MEASQFLAEFGHIANAPGGVEKLRNLVLQLAISGRLVTLENSDSSIPESLESAADQCRHYAAELKLRATRPHSPLTAAPYTVPDHWKWVRLEGISLYIQRGKGPRYADHGSVQVISQKCVQWSGFDHSLSRYVADESISDYGEERFLKGGDLLWNSTGTGTAGRVAIYPDRPDYKAVADSHVSVIRLTSIANPRYVWCVIASPWVQARIQPSHQDSLVSGTTQQVELNTSTVRELAIPYPPVEEQNRIVEKVDELMNLCSQLERQQQTRRRLQNALRHSTLQAVADAHDPYGLKESWERLETNFDSLFSEKQDVRKLRDVMCDLVLRGVTTPKSRMRQSEIFADAELRPLSHGWEWKPLSKLTEYITSGSRGWKKYIANEGDSFIRSQDIKHDELIFEKPAFVRLPEKAEGMRTLVQPSDLLITITGGNVGRCAVVPDLPQYAYVSQHVALIRLLDPRLSEFIHFWMVNAFGGQAFLARYIYGDKPGLNLKQVGSVLIPVPPIEMLPEILPSLRSYHQMCERLSDQLEEKLDVSKKFVIAAVNSITGISLVEEGPAAVKVPQTELIAPLRLGTTPDVTAQAPLTTILARHNGELPARDLWQRFGGEIDAFYAQLKTEVAHGWIAEPTVAEMLEKPAEAAGA
ncbi:restriction endonuclease subunit S [Roseinatronobacter monicus]|uniref:Type I restriction enzyme S subunit n=1 Tax=Roseinatronobacter monicus TaxID=393481 RepID=A0A543KBC8_9RHOB|nr:restriction endonuclease subunit S [Roseinatronobacter monicus]TQM92388.1 type I restriction enzyme S subunit [Roseinatronobacter monicus]